MRIEFVTLFPEMLEPFLGQSMMARAVASSAVVFGSINPRDFCYDRHRKVDDSPYGGEPGMLIRAEPVALSLESIGVTDPTAEGSKTAVILTAPTGTTFGQSLAREFSTYERLVFLCGHYEGFDHRVETQLATHVVSVGDFVLTNGELPALLMADAVVRLLPGVLGSSDSLGSDSHSDGLLSAPNYTRPDTWRGERVPDVLLSGNHGAISQWRRRLSLRLTQEIRPDLLAKAPLTAKDVATLTQPQ